MKKFIFESKKVVIEAQNEHDARRKFQKQVSAQYNKIIICSDWKCKECDCIAGMHYGECSQAMILQMLIQESTCKTFQNYKFRILIYQEEKFNAIIDTQCQALRLDVFDVKNIMESLFTGLNKEQRKNMIKILEKAKDE